MYAPDVPEIPDYGDARRLPEWYGPPQMVGGYVTGPLLLTRTDRAAVAVRQVLAFPAGMEVEIEAHARGSSSARLPSGAPDWAAGSTLHFRVQFADGRAAVQDDEAGLRSGRGPTLVVRGSEISSGGAGGGEDIRMTLWIWPLPPPGPVLMTCSWPGQGLDEATVVLDATAIRAAASHAQPFWPARET